MLIDDATQVQARAEATRLRDDFLIAAAHDLRTPLTAAIARAQFVQHRGHKNPDRGVAPAEVQRIVDDLLRLNGLMNELLDAARAEYGPLLGNLGAVDLVNLTQECANRHDWTNHSLVVDAPDRVEVEMDTRRIAQVIDNLLENAIKYSPDGGTVRLKIWRDGSTAYLTVSDSGIGIPSADLPYIFDRFYRGANVETPSLAGMGLSLYICRSIVMLHGGEISATSAEGQGTTFEVSLPIGLTQHNPSLLSSATP